MEQYPALLEYAKQSALEYIRNIDGISVYSTKSHTKPMWSEWKWGEEQGHIFRPYLQLLRPGLEGGAALGSVESGINDYAALRCTNDIGVQIPQGILWQRHINSVDFRAVPQFCYQCCCPPDAR